MDILIKEYLYVLDYDGNIVDCIFNSNDHFTPGYAYNIRISESNTGYSDLSFEMSSIINNEGKELPNPKLQYIVPLARLRYERQIIYNGDTPISVPVPKNYGDIYDCDEITYNKGDLMEIDHDGNSGNYIMDYIIQPEDKRRSGKSITLNYECMDYPRFILSKKKVGYGISDETITKPEWSLFEDGPLDVKGVVKYQKWNTNIKKGNTPISNIVEWDPSIQAYPLNDEQLADLKSTYDKNDLKSWWAYGYDNTVFYWPIVKSGRYEGVRYEEGDFLTLTFFRKTLTDTVSSADLDVKTIMYKNKNYITCKVDANNNIIYSLTAEELLCCGSGIDLSQGYGGEGKYENGIATPPEGFEAISNPNKWYSIAYPIEYEENLTCVWGTYTAPKDYLSPNKPVNYLNWILENTDWSVGVVDEPTTEVYNPETLEIEKDIPLTAGIDTDNSNCYNIITQICSTFNLYPEFDCICKKVNLRLHSGKNWGLTYNINYNVNEDIINRDGEKVITKLHCFGGDDIQSNEVINLGDADRTANVSKVYNGTSEFGVHFVGYYKASDYIYLPSASSMNINDYCISDSNLVPDKPYEIKGVRKVYKVVLNNNVNKWEEVPQPYQFFDKYIDIETGILKNTEDELWDPNNEMYLSSRSPWGTEYIYNFKWMYDNGWMTKEQILDLYKQNDKIRILNEGFLSVYINSYVELKDKAEAAYVELETQQTAYQAILNKLMTSYYKNSVDATAGSYTALPYLTPDMHINTSPEHALHNHYVNVNVNNTNIPVFINTVFDTGYSNYSKNVKINGELSTLIKFLDSTSINNVIYNYVTNNCTANGIRLTQNIPAYEFDTNHHQYKFNPGYGYLYDNSAYMYNWNSEVTNWQNDFRAYQAALVEYDKCVKDIKLLETQYENFQKEIKEIERYIQENYGDFIIEGKFQDSQVVYTSLLLDKSLEASTEYCVPKKSYDVNVIDASGLIEYRSLTKDIYHDLVRKLHSIGQIVPRAGDYCYVYDPKMGLYNVPVMITEIERYLDDPSNNSITLDSTYLDSDELVGNIITATNTVLNHEDIIKKTSSLNNKGVITQEALQKALEQFNGEGSFVQSNRGSAEMDGTGMVFVDPNNANNKMKYTAKGIYKTEDGGTTWNSIMTSDGIDASYINTGTLDTSKMRIMDERGEKVILNKNGLVIKENEDKDYIIQGDTAENVKAFIGVDEENNGKIIINGNVVANNKRIIDETHGVLTTLAFRGVVQSQFAKMGQFAQYGTKTALEPFGLTEYADIIETLMQDDGYTLDYDISNKTKDRCIFDITIPENFVILGAQVVVTSMPFDLQWEFYGTLDAHCRGHCQKLGLKAENLTNSQGSYYGFVINDGYTQPQVYGVIDLGSINITWKNGAQQYLDTSSTTGETNTSSNFGQQLSNLVRQYGRSIRLYLEDSTDVTDVYYADIDDIPRYDLTQPAKVQEMYNNAKYQDIMTHIGCLSAQIVITGYYIGMDN